MITVKPHTARTNPVNGETKPKLKPSGLLKKHARDQMSIAISVPLALIS